VHLPTPNLPQNNKTADGFYQIACMKMELTAKAIDVNNIFVDVLVTAATIISTFAIARMKFTISRTVS